MSSRQVEQDDIPPRLKRVMPLWEYHYAELTPPWEEHLDHLGGNGWELVQGNFVLRESASGPYEIYRAVFKRPILD